MDKAQKVDYRQEQCCTSTASTTSNVGDTEGEKKVRVFLEALDILTRLAAMDSVTYRKSIGALPGESSYSCENFACASSLQKRYDELHSIWNFEDSPFPRLLESIHCFHSKCNQLESHVDQVLAENESLRVDLSSSESRIRRLEAAVEKLHKKKQRLKEKLHAHNTERASLLTKVRTYVRDFKMHDEADDQHFAKHLEAHERIMKADGRRESVGNRSRCSSRDTTFSDVDVAAMYQLSDEEFGENCSIVSSASSSTSVLIDEGVASVRIDSRSKDDREDQQEYLLEYPADAKVGLQFHRMPVHSYHGALDSSIMSREEKEATKGRPVSFPLHFHLDTFLGGGKRVEESAFFVCGHHGFEDSLNIPPPLGSRLTKVNGKSLDGDASLGKIRAMTLGSNFTLAFQVERLTAKQEEILEQAVKAASLKFKEGAAALLDHDGTETFADVMETEFSSVRQTESHSLDKTPQKCEANELAKGQATDGGNYKLLNAHDTSQTHPSVKLKNQMLNVGKKFKSLF
jgi:regulator of replication initiation timing